VKISIRVDVPNDDQIAPLFRNAENWWTQPTAYLELDPAGGRVSFGVRRENQSVPEREKRGRLLRWLVHSALHGDYRKVVAEILRPKLQIVQNGYSETLDVSDRRGSRLFGHLNQTAQEAHAMIGTLLKSGLIDETNPFHVAVVSTPEEFIRDQNLKDDVKYRTTDAELDLICRESLQVAADKGTHINGSLIDALTVLRDELRETALTIF
jgi:hypothetical protein